MPDYYVSKLEDKIGDLAGKSILVLGVSYRDKVKETAFSGAFDVRDALLARGAKPYFVDPLYTQDELSGLGFDPEYINHDIEGILLHTAHEEYLDFDLKKFINLKYFLDGRNIVRGKFD
jgi:UDP-N-acetyl-D-mannosaminuronate dehydrogenase